MKNFAVALLAAAAAVVSVSAAPVVDPDAHTHAERGLASTDSDIIIRAVYAYGKKAATSKSDSDIIIKAVTAYGGKDQATHASHSDGLASEAVIRIVLAYEGEESTGDDWTPPEHGNHWWGKKN